MEVAAAAVVESGGACVLGCLTSHGTFSPPLQRRDTWQTAGGEPHRGHLTIKAALDGVGSNLLLFRAFLVEQG